VIDIIYHIDEIAREKARHVAGIFFTTDENINIDAAIAKIESLRAPIINWLDDHNVAWECCFDFFDGNLDPFYKGDIYVHIEINPHEKIFSELTALLENKDESPKVPGVYFKFFRHEDALANSEFYLASFNKI
jgi:hypothetical protein